MKAIIRNEYGGPEVLQLREIEEPSTQPNQIKVKIFATTVSRTDCGILRGKPYLIRAFVGIRKPRHLIVGTDFAGEVVEVGSKVSKFKPGDRIWGLDDVGLQSQAQYMTIRESKAIVKIPDGISFASAAASAEGAHYAFNFISKLRKLKAGDKVLVYGATGAIGSAALQLLKAMGVFVTAVGNTKNVDLLVSLGADKVVDYQTEDFTKDNLKYQAVFDAVGKSNFSTCKAIMDDGATYISSELGPGAENVYLPITTMFAKYKVKFPVPVQPSRSLNHMAKLLVEAKFNPVVERTYPMTEFENAYTYVESGQKTGNVILNITH